MSGARYSVKPFSGARYHENAQKAGDLSPCAICGKGVKNVPAAASATVIDGGSAWGDDQSDQTDPGYMGAYLIGPDCHRRHVVKAPGLTPAPRHKDFPVGRVCLICGKGGTVRLGGVGGAAPALLAIGYVWDRAETLGMAHLPCIETARRKARTVTIQGQK